MIGPLTAEQEARRDNAFDLAAEALAEVREEILAALTPRRAA